MTSETTTLGGACSAKEWADTAIDNELASLVETVTRREKITKPGSPFFVCLLKIASIVRGGHVPEHEAINGIKKSLCTYPHVDQRDIDYQWKRAMRQAKPRHPSQQNRLPINTKPIEEPAWNIYEYDLNTCQTRVLRQVPPKIVSKARYLAGVISEFLETGAVPLSLNFGLSVRFDTVNGTLVRISFHKYTASLADCVYVAVTMAGCSLWYPLADYTHGWFDFFAL